MHILSPSSWQSLATAGISWGGAQESGRSKSQLRLVSDSFTSLFNSFKHAFRHDGNTAIERTFTTMSLLYRVPAVFALETAKQPDAALVGSLSYRDARARKL